LSRTSRGHAGASRRPACTRWRSSRTNAHSRPWREATARSAGRVRTTALLAWSSKGRTGSWPGSLPCRPWALENRLPAHHALGTGASTGLHWPGSLRLTLRAHSWWGRAFLGRRLIDRARPGLRRDHAPLRNNGLLRCRPGWPRNSSRRRRTRWWGWRNHSRFSRRGGRRGRRRDHDCRRGCRLFRGWNSGSSRCRNRRFHHRRRYHNRLLRNGSLGDNNYGLLHHSWRRRKRPDRRRRSCRMGGGRSGGNWLGSCGWMLLLLLALLQQS
jgi:hypothetical protein